MTKAQAMKEATKRWGKNAYISHNPKAPSKQAREAARAALDALRPIPHKERTPEQRQEAKRLWGIVSWHPYQVGEITMLPFGPCAHICGSGDSWEEAFASAKH